MEIIQQRITVKVAKLHICTYLQHRSVWYYNDVMDMLNDIHNSIHNFCMIVLLKPKKLIPTTRNLTVLCTFGMFLMSMPDNFTVDNLCSLLIPYDRNVIPSHDPDCRSLLTILNRTVALL